MTTTDAPLTVEEIDAIERHNEDRDHPDWNANPISVPTLRKLCDLARRALSGGERVPVGTNAYHCTPDTPQSVPATVSAPYTPQDMANALSSANVNIAALIVERDTLKAKLETSNSISDTNHVAWEECSAERDKLREALKMIAAATEAFERLIAERDKLRDECEEYSRTLRKLREEVE